MKTIRDDRGPDTFLCATKDPDTIDAVRETLESARIPYRTGLMAGARPVLVFTVPGARLDHAREALATALGDESPVALPESAGKSPWGPIKAVGVLIALHFLIVFWMIGSADSGRNLIRWGGLLKGMTIDQPWRMLTSLFLHVDPLHAFWNGASMMVFAVPLLVDLRYWRTCLIYLASGIGGGITALYFARGGTLIVGSSGAVAGLFGAWLVLTLGKTRFAPLTRRARIRTLGIAMLFLPSLLSPITSTGNTVSVGSHLGGLATGMAIGMALSTGLVRHLRHARIGPPG